MKRPLVLFILLLTVLMLGKAYCQDDINGPLIRTIAGKVVTVDPEAGIINVLTDNGRMVFNITSQSNLYRNTARMASIEIGQGDSVKILYDSTKNDVIRLVDNKADEF